MRGVGRINEPIVENTNFTFLVLLFSALKVPRGSLVVSQHKFGKSRPEKIIGDHTLLGFSITG